MKILSILHIALPIFGFAPPMATMRQIGRRGGPKSATNFRERTILEEGKLRSDDKSGKENNIYDLIVVGSGNGACALLSECLKYAPDSGDYNILVLEEGNSFYAVSAITHENGWSRAYSTGNIFKLHNAVSPGGRAIISGRALGMGGGGS